MKQEETLLHHFRGYKVNNRRQNLFLSIKRLMTDYQHRFEIMQMYLIDYESIRGYKKPYNKAARNRQIAYNVSRRKCIELDKKIFRIYKLIKLIDEREMCKDC